MRWDGRWAEGLPSVRRVLSRVRAAALRSTAARPSAGSSAARLSGLLVPAGGWLPPAADGPRGSGGPASDGAAQDGSAADRLGATDVLPRWDGLPAQYADPTDLLPSSDGDPATAGPAFDDPASRAAEADERSWLGGWRDHADDDAREHARDHAADDAHDDAHDDAADEADGQRSWAPSGRHVASEPSQRWRLDLGRSAVGALLLVAALAAVIAAGVVLRGRPQEVAVPVLDGRAAAASEAATGTGDDGAPPAVEASGVPLPGGPEPVAAAAPSGQVVVAVAGKVRTPGLVRLPAGSRVDDAVRAAGGPVDPAAVGLLNLARVLVDGEQVLVGVDPPPGSTQGAVAGGPPGAASSGGPLDLNAASASDLDALPGIGPVLAQRIVDWRTENGRFASVDQLREVTGIGEAKYQDLVEKVVV